MRERHTQREDCHALHGLFNTPNNHTPKVRRSEHATAPATASIRAFIIPHEHQRAHNGFSRYQRIR
jgi:hypothetical protein